MEKIKVTVIYGFEEEDYKSRLKIKGLSKDLDFIDGEDEDNKLGRNFSSCYNISELMLEANQLGLKGQEIEITYIEDNDIFSDNYED